MWIYRTDFLDIYNRLSRLGGHPPSKSHGVVTLELMQDLVDAFEEVHRLFPAISYIRITTELTQYNFRNMYEMLKRWENA